MFLGLFITAFRAFPAEIDGIKLRLKKSDLSFFLSFAEEEFETLSDENYNRSENLVQCPLELAFKDTTMYFGFVGFYIQSYLDFELANEGNDMELLDASDRSTIYTTFLTEEEKTVADNNSSWTLSADHETSSLVLGAKFGIFFGPSETNRFFKLGVGVDYIYLSYDIAFKLCESYEIEGDKGRCVNERIIDEASGNTLNIQLSFHFTLWEIRTERSVWAFYEIYFASRSTSFGFPLIKQTLDLDNRDCEGIRFERSLNSTTLVSYTYLF